MSTHTEALWYAERASGIVAYLLLTVLVVLGLTLSSRARSRAWPAFAIEDVHRFVGILAGVFIALHVSLMAIDSFLPFSLTQILVPFTATYRPLATGLGTVALELVLAVAISNVLRRRIGRRTWRALHYLGFGVWAAATAHGLLAGTDRHDSWLLAIDVAAVAAVVTGLVYRAAEARPRLSSATGIGLAAAVVVVAVLTLLPQAPSPSNATVVQSVQSVPDAYSGSLTARIEQQVGDEESLLSISGRATGSASALVRIDLLGSEDGLRQTALQIRFSDGAGCVGTVSRIDTSGFAGSCSTPDGHSRTVQGTWSVVSDVVRGRLTLA
jgi:DMSO/TMAO reductase YedYZ heme-binding membrane subunit